MKRMIPLLVGAAATLGLSSTPAAQTSSEDGQQANGAATYVALGSSYASGPGVGSPANDIDARCQQSASNYPHLLASALRLRLIDKSCAGSTTDNILRGGQFGQGPQIDALTPATRLVTVTSGGNDVGFISSLFSWSCAREPAPVPQPLRVLACKPGASANVDESFAKVEANLRAIAVEVQRRAPRARLVFVDYFTVLPTKGHCPSRLPVSDAELDKARALAERLRTITATVARESGAVLVEASRITEPHNICSADPWFFGWTFPKPGAWGPTAYHPKAAAMSAIARAIAERTRSTTPQPI